MRFNVWAAYRKAPNGWDLEAKPLAGVQAAELPGAFRFKPYVKTKLSILWSHSFFSGFFFSYPSIFFYLPWFFFFLFFFFFLGVMLPWILRPWHKLNVGFYIALFQSLIKVLLHLIPLPLEYCQLPYNVQGIIIPLDGAQWTIFQATT